MNDILKASIICVIIFAGTVIFSATLTEAINMVFDSPEQKYLVPQDEMIFNYRETKVDSWFGTFPASEFWLEDGTIVLL